MIDSVRNAVQPLSILCFFICIAVVLFSSMMYYAERGGCPDVVAMRASGSFVAYQAECIELDSGWTSGGVLCCDELGSAIDFPSIFTTFWWSVVTMTTVGYGDKVPRTNVGRFIAGVAMLCGILLISLPVAIVGSKFQEAYEDQEEMKAREREEERERVKQDVP